MIPKDLSAFSVEQLRAFATAVRENATDLSAEIKASENKDPDQVSRLSHLADERDRLATAIEAALEAEKAEGDVDDAAAAGGEGDEGGETTTTEDEETEGDGEDGDKPADTETKVDDAVASAKLGGGAGPSVTNERAESRSGDIRKFLKGVMSGEVRHEHRIGFTSLRRETNHSVKEGANATEAILAARADRVAGIDKTAAGCFCGPDDARDAIVYSGVTDRPFSDTLPTITANGDYRFIRQIPLADALAGVTEWLCADQDAVDPAVAATWKPCVDLECQPEITSTTYAVVACAQFTTQQMIGNAALIDNLQHVMEVVYNRTAEAGVYNRVLAHASQYNFGLPLTGYGASAQMIAAVGWAIELIRQNQRSLEGYNLVLPAGVRERILADGQVRGMDDYEVWTDFQNRIEALGIDTVVQLLDPIGPVTALAARGAAAVAAPPHEPTRQVLLYRPEDFLLGLNPEVDLGVTRSPELARQNKLQWFTESFESVERVGTDPAVALNVELCLSGIRPALGTGEDCTA